MWINKEINASEFCENVICKFVVNVIKKVVKVFIIEKVFIVFGIWYWMFGKIFKFLNFEEKNFFLVILYSIWFLFNF